MDGSNAGTTDAPPGDPSGSSAPDEQWGEQRVRAEAGGRFGTGASGWGASGSWWCSSELPFHCVPAVSCGHCVLVASCLESANHEGATVRSYEHMFRAEPRDVN